VERVVTTFMAGFAAEIKLGSADPEGSWYDIDLLQRQWLGYLEPDPQRRPGLVRRFLARAQAELDAPGVWTAVEAVASALLSEVRLDGPRARELATA
jgi:L-amino acid N-acyltransferase YncA